MMHQLSWIQRPKEPVKKLVWVTDLHLDAADLEAQAYFLDELLNSKADLFLVGGDICNGAQCLHQLEVMQKALNKPMYFVLGNHDYYHGSIEDIRQLARNSSASNKNLKYLTEGHIVELTADTALIGHDGWSDGREGDFLASTIQLNDYFLIKELSQITPEERLKRLNAYGQQAADSLKAGLLKAFEKFQRVVVLTHVPPYRNACQYHGQETDDNWAPHFVGRSTGDALLEVMKAHPDKQLLVLCGHTHSPTDLFITDNMRVVAGESDLGTPSIQGLLLLN